MKALYDNVAIKRSRMTTKLYSSIRIPNRQKARLLATSFFKYQLNML